MVLLNFIRLNKLHLFLVCVWALLLYGMPDVYAAKYQKFSRSALLENEAGKQEALLQLRSAGKNVSKGGWHLIDADEAYDSVIVYNSTYQPLLYKAGYNAVQLGNGTKALRYLLECDSSVASDYYLTRGRAFQLDLQFDEAIADYRSYQAIAKKSVLKKVNADIDKYISQCDVGKKIIDNVILTNFEQPEGDINSKWDDFSPKRLSMDKSLLFTSNRPSIIKNKPKFRGEEALISLVSIQGDSVVSALEPFSKHVSSRKNEGIVAVTPSGDEVIVFRGDYGNGDLWSLNYREGEWKRPAPFMPYTIASRSKESSMAFIGTDIIIFSSERKRGTGGKDIYITKRIKENKWSKPVSIGANINTKYDEKVCSYSSANSRLYFASNSEKSMGGYDIWYVECYADDTFSDPKHLGYPLNTANNEFDFYMTQDTTEAWISTDRVGTKGGLDILKVTLLNPEPDKHFVLTGYIQDKLTDIAIGNATLEFRTIPGDSTVAIVTTDTTGLYYNRFDLKGAYRALISASGFNETRKVIQTSMENPDTLYTEDFKLVKVEIVDNSIDLMGITKNSKSELPVGVSLSITMARNDSAIATITSDSLTGKYFVTLPDKREGYMIKALADNYHPNAFLLSKSLDLSVWNHTIMMAPIEEDVMLFSGAITDVKTGNGVPAALHLTNPLTQKDTIIYADSTSGYYQFEVKERVGMMAEIKAKKYFTINQLLKTPANKDEWISYNNFTMQPLVAGEKIVLDNILFQSGRSILLSQSNEALDKVYTLLVENGELKVEISGHTDSSGALALNQKLSENRAKAVVDYLVNKGMDSSRITSKGYGPSVPIAKNDTKEGRAKNRRVEFKILED